ncbi:MAG TPA: large-conductance mechanosensitive channel protein MscL [Candidatus Avidehalobacter gallistercoris]|uniref:Large-conductance mechanosensitive channel n=1 Tax=Candidatus Avidehalobacter gallistercoris TaxID=2840694 RepID=A0A9D1HLH5_9FIRM|nr:large-conductance mechanosensitive channel protein MscL [Candidatus Avidehalobacter gallistercoris]
MAKKGFVAEFKEFIARGNVIDMAVGIIIGGAFTNIVTSLVNDIIMPLIATLTGAITFTQLFVTFNNTIIPYGNFIQNVVNFLLTAFTVFIMIKTINNFRRQKEEPAPAPESSEEVLLLREIRDSLQK